MTQSEAYDSYLDKMAALLQRNIALRAKMQDQGFPPAMLELIDKIVDESERAMAHLLNLRLKVV